MSTAEQPAESSNRRKLSVWRISALVVPSLLVALWVGYEFGSGEEARSREEGQRMTLSGMGLSKPTRNRLARRFHDVNGDLVADPPTDPLAIMNPPVIYFSYIPGDRQEHAQRAWRDVINHLAFPFMAS